MVGIPDGAIGYRVPDLATSHALFPVPLERAAAVKFAEFCGNFLEIRAADEDVVVVREDTPSRGLHGEGREQLLRKLGETCVGVADVGLVLEAGCREVIVDGALVKMGRAMPRAFEQLAIG